MKKDKDKLGTNNRILRISVAVAIIFILIICFTPIIFTQFSSSISFEETGQIGDTIGGVTAPFLAILGAFLTFIAFYVQYQANRSQLERIELIDERDQLNQYESKLQSMLESHRNNVRDIVIRLPNDQKYEGYEAINYYIKKFDFIFNALKQRNDLSIRQNTVLSHLILFYGQSLYANSSLHDYYKKYFDHRNDIIDPDFIIQALNSIGNYKKSGFGYIFSRYFRYQFQIINYIAHSGEDCHPFRTKVATSSTSLNLLIFLNSSGNFQSRYFPFFLP